MHEPVEVFWISERTQTALQITNKYALASIKLRHSPLDSEEVLYNTKKNSPHLKDRMSSSLYAFLRHTSILTP